MVIKIDKTNISPEIIFDIKSKIVDINGRMLMEDAISYFIDVKEHIELIKGDITLNIDLDYINSSSLSQLLRLLRTNKQIKHINWYYDSNDTDTLKTGEVFTKMLADIKIEIIVKPE